jgi:hypothetical protein
MKTIMLTSSNYVGNSTFKYYFRTTLKAPDDIAAVAISNIEFYNMSYNITSSVLNNYLELNWLGTIYLITFSDGYYSATDMNSQIQSFCYLNNLYVTSSDGKIGYFIEIVENAPLYKIQLNFYAIPTAAQATTLGYTLPTSALWTFPVIAATPQIIMNTNFGKLIGFYGDTYPSTSFSTSQSYVSAFSPVISPINSYIFTCSMINNPYGTLSDHIATVALTSSLGSIVKHTPPAIIPHEIFAGQYQSFTMTLYDQDYNLLQINDNEFNITLALISAKELKYLEK